jgi:hypothetical protein
MRMLIATYHVSSGFKVPPHIPLLSVEENREGPCGSSRPWSWWIKYDTLHYYDAEGKEHLIEPEYRAYESDFKHTDEQKFEDDPDFDDEEKDTCCKDITKDTPCKYYCDIHENTHLCHDGDEGFYCYDCDNEEEPAPVPVKQKKKPKLAPVAKKEGNGALWCRQCKGEGGWCCQQFSNEVD